MPHYNEYEQIWTLIRVQHAAAPYFLAKPVMGVIGPSIIVIPNISGSERYVEEWCSKKFGEYNLEFHIAADLFIPTEHLAPPFQFSTLIVPVHIYTPYPPSYDDSKQNSYLSIPVIPSKLDTTSEHQPPCSSFTLTKKDLREPLPHRICQRTRIKLLHHVEGNPLVEELATYEVVGSLGLFLRDTSKEVLLLRSESTQSGSSHIDVRLRVHPTHVGQDVGFLSNYPSQWMKDIVHQAYMWFKGNGGSYSEKLALMQIWYINNVRSLRSQGRW